MMLLPAIILPMVNVPLCIPSGPVIPMLSSWALPPRLTLEIASKRWLNDAAVEHHYMHRKVHDRACPFGWRVKFDGLDTMPDGKPCGFIMFCSVHFIKLRGEFGYPGLPTKWQVLSLARLWLNDDMPKMSASCVIAKSHKLVQSRWLEVHPPKYLDQPYEIQKIISFADNEYHKGTVYKAAGYRLAGKTVSKRRHHNTRGIGMDGHTLTRYIYDLPKRRSNVKLQQEIFTVGTDYAAARQPLFEALP